jgi:hypothetical protein
VVEGTGLENRQAGDRLVGSNPTPSARIPYLAMNFFLIAEMTHKITHALT